MQQIYQNINRFLSAKTFAFLKRSFFFAFLYSTLLYIAVRLFFYEFPFTISEEFELHSKILLVTWIFIIVCKLAFTGIILLENINKMKLSRITYAKVFKTPVLIMLMAVLANTSKTGAAGINKITDTANNSTDEIVMEPEPGSSL